MPAVEVSSLVVRYGTVTAVDGVSFSAAQGEVVALLGPNGAGKTSTVETLEGYREPSAGSVRVLDLDPVEDRTELSGRMGVMLQQGGVYPMLGPRAAVRLFASYYADAEDPDGLVERCGLGGAAHTPYRRLSGGEQRRLALALAVVGKPQVAFLDEPTAGADPLARQLVREVVRELRERGACVLLASHDLAEVEEVADRVVIVDRGRVVAEGSPTELGKSSAGLSFEADAGLDVSGLGGRLGHDVKEVAPGEYRISATSSPELVASLTALLAERGVLLSELRTRSRLEDVFLLLTGGSEANVEDHR